jgi:serine/threonine protein kinase
MHSLGFLHRDIKPNNIMFSKYYDKFVYIDFGIS